MPRTAEAGGSRWRAGLLGVLLGLYISSPAYAAFTPSTAPLLSSAVVTPNVMLMVDDSGSMANIIRATAFDQSVSRAQIYFCAADRDWVADCSTTSTPAMDDENVSLSELYQGSCDSGYYGFSKTSRSNSKTTAADYCLKLPDPEGSKGTRYSARYLAYLTTLAGSQTTKDFTTGTIPTDSRINVARTVSAALVTANRGLRIGLATFNPATTKAPGNGGYIVRPIMDLQASTVSKTTAATGTSNYNALLSSIKSLDAVSNTPLAETYYEITRYFRGLPSFYNSGTYDSPIQYRCQRNFGVVITDGLPTYDRTFPNNDPADPSGILPNWDKAGVNGDNASGDSEGDTLYLDDIAKFAYDIDMRTGTTTTDAAGKSWDDPDFLRQNLFTYTVGFTAANEMLSRAASNGHGKYYQAADSATLTAALTQALNDISSKAGSGGGGTTTSSTSYNANYYYQSLYDPTDWSGTIRAYKFDATGTLDTSIPVWTTDTTLAATNTAGTFESWNTSTNKVIPLLWGNFSSSQQSTLTSSLTNLSTYTSTGKALTGASLIEWLKGTTATGLKTRTVLLGDVVNSPVVLASAKTQTASDLTGDTSYSAYLATKSTGMTDSILVNANDGLTNVLRASDGQRRYAYLPSTTLPSLSIVEDPTYVDGVSHKFLNDGPLSVYDAKIGSAWKTLAFGGAGAGGKAIYAFQLYDATAGNVYKALWEIRPDTAPANTFVNLGYGYARVAVARLPDANGTWAAFIANGYGSSTGLASLYVVNVADGTLIKEMVVKAGETDNGLSSVALTVNSSNVVQAAYAGDLKGRLWKFDLSSTNTSSWGLAFSGNPLFTASTDGTKPITAQPLVVPNATSGYTVYFGTGKFNEISDKTTTAVQAFYGVWDAAGGTGNFALGNLQPQSITGTFTQAGDQYLTVSQNPVDYTSKKGWYLPLSYNNTLVGERVINQAAYTRGRIVFTTAGVDTTDPCSSQGFGRLVELDALTGNMLTYPVIDTNGDGLVDASDSISAGSVFSSGIPTLNAVVSDDSGTAIDTKVVNTSNAEIKTIKELGGSSGSNRRIMWRQIQ